MNLMAHAIDLAFGSPPKVLPKPGVTVLFVTWDGCMATIRNERDVGDLVRYETRNAFGARRGWHKEPRDYPGVVVKWDDRGEHWEPLDRLRVVDRQAEIWS